jgi:tetrapyrrole methylase family protein/MazG family protein
MQEFDELVEVIDKLRNECPWDKEQTHETLAKHLIEEAYELLDAIAKLGSSDLSFENLKDELGDLLLQILLHSKIASENNYFSIVSVIENLTNKLVKRHPHVFGDVKLENATDVEKQWEEIKGKNSDSIFDDINEALPPITKAFKAQRKAKKINLSYPNYEEALDDLISEINELKNAKDETSKKSEIGDVLFALINVCRYLNTDPEIELNKSTKRFIERAKYVEKNIELNPDIEELWNLAKKNE